MLCELHSRLQEAGWLIAPRVCLVILGQQRFKMLDAPPPLVRLKHEGTKTVLGDKVPGAARTNAQTFGRILYGRQSGSSGGPLSRTNLTDLIGDKMDHRIDTAMSRIL